MSREGASTSRRGQQVAFVEGAGVKDLRREVVDGPLVAPGERHAGYGVP